MVVDVTSGDWEERNAPLFYSKEKRSWYCNECDFLMESPRTAGAHAKKHGLPLPFSRTKTEVELVQVVQQTEIEPPKTKTNDEAFEQRMHSYFPNQNRTNNQNLSSNYVPLTPLDEKIQKRLVAKMQIQRMQLSGCFSDEEIKEKEIELGLRPKEEPPKNEGLKNSAIVALQNRYFDEDDEAVRSQILFTISLIENEPDPSKIPVLLSMAPRPSPKKDNTEKLFLMMASLYLKKQEEPSLLDNPEKFVKFMKLLRKKPVRKSPNQNSTPSNTVDNSMEQTVNP